MSVKSAPKGGHPVEALLAARGSTKRWLAKKIGLTEYSLNRYLSGDRTPPEDLNERMADVLHVPVAFLTAHGAAE